MNNRIIYHISLMSILELVAKKSRIDFIDDTTLSSQITNVTVDNRRGSSIEIYIA